MDCILTVALPVPSFLFGLAPPFSVETVHVVLVVCRFVRVIAAGMGTVEAACPAVVAIGAVRVRFPLAAASLPRTPTGVYGDGFD